MDMPLKINNADMRKLWLNTTGLAKTPTGPLDVLQIIKDLGFVQLDTIQNVVRAHHHILWSRNQNYREPMLDELLGRDNLIFEHFTHDASVIPVEFYPMWTRQFTRLKKWLDNTKRYQSILAETDLNAIRTRIENEGPLSTHAFNTKLKDKKKMWSRPPHKLGLDYLWYAGELSTSHREKFKKFYDLSHRVIPKQYHSQKIADTDQITWLCNAALERLSFGTLKDIQKFWDATHKTEVEKWFLVNETSFKKISWQSSDGNWLNAIASHDIEQRLGNISSPSTRLRIINPFDPAIRDRDRLKNIFGFDYKIEIFVPAVKRKWGYYVYPILEGTRFIGRIELKADRNKKTLSVINFWPEDGVTWTSSKYKKLEAELSRLARFINVQKTINIPKSR